MQQENSLAMFEKESIVKLLLKFALPAIASMVVNSIYNIVDQIFIANASYLGSCGVIPGLQHADSFYVRRNSECRNLQAIKRILLLYYFRCSVLYVWPVHESDHPLGWGPEI